MPARTQLQAAHASCKSHRDCCITKGGGGVRGVTKALFVVCHCRLCKMAAAGGMLGIYLCQYAAAHPANRLLPSLPSRSFSSGSCPAIVATMAVLKDGSTAIFRNCRLEEGSRAAMSGACGASTPNWFNSSLVETSGNGSKLCVSTGSDFHLMYHCSSSRLEHFQLGGALLGGPCVGETCWDCVWASSCRTPCKPSSHISSSASYVMTLLGNRPCCIGSSCMPPSFVTVPCQHSKSDIADCHSDGKLDEQ